MTKDLSSAEQSFKRGADEKARVVAQSALPVHPDWPRAHMLAASNASRLGRFEDARRHLDICRNTLELVPDDLGTHLNIAKLYSRINEFEIAIEILEPLLTRVGETPELLDDLVVNLHQTGRFGEAVAIYKKLLMQAPENLNIHHNICAALLAGGKAKRAASRAAKWLQLAPGDTEALSFRAVALEEAGEEAAANRLMNFDRFVTSKIMVPPSGYGSISTFNKSLEIAILSHPDLETLPQDSNSYHDRSFKSTGRAQGPGTGPIGVLEKLIKKNVDAYYAKLNKPASHPFIAARPENYDLMTRAIVAEKQGAQNPHIHFNGHVSGYYYACIPEESGFVPHDGGKTVVGGLEVGTPPPDLGCKRSHRNLVIKPEEGMMVLFPSYMYHRTVSFKSCGRRICVAFIVIGK